MRFFKASWTWVFPLILVVGLGLHYQRAIASGIQAFAIVPAGGTGLNTLTAHTVLVGAGTSPVSLVGPGTSGNCLTSGGASADPAFTTCGGGSANQQIRSWGGSFDGGGSALTSGKTTYVTVPFACTIAAWNILVDTGTASFDVWKVATGTAIPTVSNSILTGGFLSIGSGTALHSTTLTAFTTTTVSANDIVGINLEAVSGATIAQLVIQCNATT
jgi:hypothetical protein